MLVDRHQPPYKTAGAVLLVIAAVVGAFIYLQFRGDLTDKTKLTLLSPRAGLVVEPGSKVTYNGVEIGRVAHITMVDERGTAMAKLTLDVNPRYIQYIPANVEADIRATTVFGNKYISFSSPKNPSPQRISSPRRDRGVGGDHRVQHAVRNGHVNRRAGGSHQAEPDADRDRRGAHRAGRPVRRIAGERQPDPRRPESADAADRRRQPQGWPTWPTSTPTPRPTCGRAGQRGAVRAAPSTTTAPTSTRR